MRTHTDARTAFGATALALVIASSGCGSGGPGTYLVDSLDLTDKPVAAAFMPMPGR